MKTSKLNWYSRLILLITSILVITLIICTYRSKPLVQLGFLCNDPTLSFPYNGDTVQFSFLLQVIFIGTLLLILGIEYSGEKTWCKFVKKWYLEYLKGLSINSFVVVFIKRMVSAPRPHFFESCLPDTMQNCSSGEYITSYECTNANISKSLLSDSQLSFPSGHTSLVVYTSLFWVWYTYYRLNSQYWNVMIKQFIISSSLIWCAITTVTRLTDHRHHLCDVAVGGVLGLANAAYQVFSECNRFQTIKKPSKSA